MRPDSLPELRTLPLQDKSKLTRKRIGCTGAILAGILIIGGVIYEGSGFVNRMIASAQDRIATHSLLGKSIDLNGLNLLQYSPRLVMVRSSFNDGYINYLDRDTQRVMGAIDQACGIRGSLGEFEQDPKVILVATENQNCLDTMSQTH